MNSYDKETVEGILAGKEDIVRHFFYDECAPMFSYIIYKIFDRQVKKDELINELYLYLQADNWRKLRQFDYRSKLTTWLSVVAIRFFRKKRAALIENSEMNAIKEDRYDPLKNIIMKMDIHSALERMSNIRYREVLYELFINDTEPEVVAKKMNITLANLYNLKHRAIQQIAEIMERKNGYD